MNLDIIDKICVVLVALIAMVSTLTGRQKSGMTAISLTIFVCSTIWLCLKFIK